MRKRVLIVGAGYVGRALASELARQGHDVFALRRALATSEEDAGSPINGVTPVRADITKPETLAPLPRDFDWVVNCAATGGGSVDEYRALYVKGNINLIEWLRSAPPAKFLYTSSTSVYGQNDGSLVSEDDAVAPAAETAKVLGEAESVLLNAFAKSAFPAIIFRVAGIYGPGRGYWLKQFLRGEARLDGDGSRYLNMIHLEDVVGAAFTALNTGTTGSVYNAVDNEPITQKELFTWLAAKLNKPMPPTADQDEELNRKRGATNKRVSNRRLRQLGYQLKYPTFREGYAAELEQMRIRADTNR